jgi:Flp pilus assembly pilin Flp
MFINNLTAKLYNRVTSQRGQGIIEYVLLISFIAITLIGSLISFKETIYNILTSIPFSQS